VRNAVESMPGVARSGYNCLGQPTRPDEICIVD